MSLQAHVSLQRPGFALEATFHARRGEFLAVFGASGAGKSSLLRCIAGLEPDMLGKVRHDGQDWHAPPYRLPVHARGLAYVAQRPRLFPHWSVAQNLIAAPRFRGQVASDSRLDALVEDFGLAGMLHRQVSGLSGGERQRLAIARALAVEPRVLLLDEPVSALDHSARQTVLAGIRRWVDAANCVALLVTHHAQEAAQLADQMLLLDRGTAQAQGPASELLTRLDLAPARTDDASALVEGQIRAAGPSDGVHAMEFIGGLLWLAGTSPPSGTRVRARVLARDVSIALQHATDTSILNILPVTIEQIEAQGDGLVMLRLRCADTCLLSRITLRSLQALQLKPGQRVYAQIKAVSLLA